MKAIAIDLRLATSVVALQVTSLMKHLLKTLLPALGPLVLGSQLWTVVQLLIFWAPLFKKLKHSNY